MVAGPLSIEEVSRSAPSVADRVEATLERAREHLMGLQASDGHWRGLLETNVTMDAEDLLLREFLGIRDGDRLRRSAAAGFAPTSRRRDLGQLRRWSRRSVDDDRGLLGAEARRRRSRRASTWQLAAGVVRERGGPRAARVFTHIWMALFGLWPWDDGPGAAPGDDVPTDLVAAEPVRLRLLGPPDDRRADDRPRPSPRASLGPSPWTELGPGAPASPVPPMSLTGRAR